MKKERTRREFQERIAGIRLFGCLVDRSRAVRVRPSNNLRCLTPQLLLLYAYSPNLELGLLLRYSYLRILMRNYLRLRLPQNVGVCRASGKLQAQILSEAASVNALSSQISKFWFSES